MKEFWKKTFGLAIPLFIGLAMTVITFFIIFRFEGIAKAFSALLSIMITFVYGGVMAYLLKTPYNWIEKKLGKLFKGKKPGLVRGLSVIIVLLLTLAIIIILLQMVIPALVESIVSIINEVPAATASLEKLVADFAADNEVIGNYIYQGINAISTGGVTWLKDTILPELGGIMGGVAGAFGSVIGVIYNILIGMIICIYLLLGKSNFARQGKMVIYSIFKRNTAEKVLDEFAFIDKTFVGFFGGKILDSAVVGMICYVFCLIMQLTLGMKNAVLIAVIIGVTNIIPFFGPFIGAIPSALIIMMDSPICCLIFIIFVVILQTVDGNVIGPMLLSGSVGLSGFWVLFAITLFGGLLGIVGILIGVPVFAVIYDFIKRQVYKMLAKHEISEYLPPKPAEEEA
ncbi:MAG: AI-2E family transporter [Butyrivibrio sp.]|nr:AI-2E family transporter [Butyrivibrio sp.]